QHVDVVNADLQHDAAGHARRTVTPRIQINLAESIAADIAFGLDQLAEATGVYLRFDPAEMVLAATLVSYRQYHTGLLAFPRDFLALMHRIGDWFLEKDVLAGLRRHAGGFEVSHVRRGVDDCLDARIREDRLVARRG